MKCAFLKGLVLSSFALLPFTFAQDVIEETFITASPLDLFTKRSADVFTWADQTSSSFQEYLQKQPAIQVRTNGSPTLSIRGSLAADRTLSLFGLAPLQVGDGTGPAYVLLGEEIFDSLYIYKGPSSLHFGSKATGGAFRFLPKPREKNRIHLYAGSFDQYSGDIQANLLKKGSHHLQATFFQETFHNSYDHKAGLGFEEGRWAPNNSDSRRASLLYFYKNSYTALLYGKKVGYTPAALGFAKTNYDQNAKMFTHYNEYQINSTNLIKGQISYLETENKYSQGNLSKITNQVANANLHIESYFSDHFLNLLQVQWNESHLRNQYSTVTRFEQQELDIGLQQIHSYFDVSFEPQLRYLQEYDTWIKGLTISKNITYLSYTEGYRSPTLTSLYLDDSSSVKNSDLKPEQSKQIEIGYKKAAYEVKLYHLKYTDMFKTILNGGKYQTVNESSATIHGAELSLHYKNVFFDIDFSTNYMHSKDSNDDPLPLSPRLQSGLSVSYYYAFLQFQPQIRHWYKYYLQDFATGLERADNWTTFDIHIHTYGFKNWQVSIGVDNLFEEQRTFDVGYPESLRKYFVQYRLYF